MKKKLLIICFVANSLFCNKHPFDKMIENYSQEQIDAYVSQTLQDAYRRCNHNYKDANAMMQIVLECVVCDEKCKDVRSMLLEGLGWTEKDEEGKMSVKPVIIESMRRAVIKAEAIKLLKMYDEIEKQQVQH